MLKRSKKSLNLQVDAKVLLVWDAFKAQSSEAVKENASGFGYRHSNGVKKYDALTTTIGFYC